MGWISRVACRLRVLARPGLPVPGHALQAVTEPLASPRTSGSVGVLQTRGTGTLPLSRKVHDLVRRTIIPQCRRIPGPGFN